MKIKLIVLLFLISSLNLPDLSHAALIAKPGTKCAKLKATQIVNGKKYVCTKLGSRLIWDSGTILQNKVDPILGDKVPNSPALGGTLEKPFDLTVAQAHSVDIVDLDMVTKGSISTFTSEYIQKVSDAAPGYAMEYCKGLLKKKSEVLIKDGNQTLGVAYYMPQVNFLERAERTPATGGGSYLAWSYVCYLQADFKLVNRVNFYDIYVNGIRIATEPQGRIISSNYRITYPSSSRAVCLTGTVPGLKPGVLRCS